MSKELIVSVNGREKKIAILEDDVVTEFYVERGDENQGIVGNIYKGRVMKVLPGMQSAFVDIGLERDSFLYVSDFFDEEMEEDLDLQTQRPERQEREESYERRERRDRRGRREAVPVFDVEQEAELAAAAISHIEDLTEEPELEPAPGDELLTAGAAIITGDGDAIVKVVPEEEPRRRRGERDARRRRRDRLRVAEEAPAVTPEEEAEALAFLEGIEGVPPLDEAETEAVNEAIEAAEIEEAEEEVATRRRRRRRRRPASEEVETSETESEGTTVETEAEHEPVVIVHHNPFERINDDEWQPTAGDSLKDALVQERIAEQHNAEIFDVEPTPEVTVGSLSGSLKATEAFERISDDEDGTDKTSEEPIIIRNPTGALDSWPETERRVQEFLPRRERDTLEMPFPQLDDLNDLAELSTSETGPLAEDAAKNQAVVDWQGEVEMVSLAPSEAPAEDDLPNASAAVRTRPRRGEFATRRGGRGRRRTEYRQRTGATDATAEAEEAQHEELADVSGNGYAAKPAPSTRAYSSGGGSGGRSSYSARPVITDLLREGQEIIVQIAKEPIGQKGARITSHVALPGRYIVYMPTVEHIGVSRKIGTDEERMRLKRTLQQLRAEAGGTGGFIVRTAANGCTNEELREDMNYLLRTWADIRRRADRAKAPAIVHRDLDLVQRILRDQLSSDFNAIRVDNEYEYERVVDFVSRFAPKLTNRVKLYTKDTPILDQYAVQPEIDKAVKPRVWLRSGGYIVINQTEALVAIDVNTGKFVGKSNRLEDTITKTNLEAAKEIVRQIRLRDLGGIIVLDFIDMEERRNRAKVLQALEQEMRADKAPSKILQFNDFGLVAVTRKRVKQSLERTLCTPCSYCSGGGMVKSAQTVSYEILAEARRISKEVDDANEVILRVHPEIAKALRSSERDVLHEIEAYLGGVITLKSDPTVHQEQFDIALA
jgi:ribonuclease G